MQVLPYGQTLLVTLSRFLQGLLFLSLLLCAHTDAERKSIYTLFLESVQSRLRRGEESPADTVTEQLATKRSLIKMQSIVARHLELDDINDPLLAINFARSFALL